jgi:ornithine--oxo-acid transaminase
MTSNRTAQFIQLEERYGAHNYHPLDLVVERAEGCWVYDVEGNRYLDCLSSYSALNQGHCHPRLLQTLLEQASKVTLTSRAFRNDQLPRLYEKLHQISGKARALPMNSGAEAVETALKMARKWGYKVKGIPENQAQIIVFKNNFHGRTISIVSFSTEKQYRDGFGPYTPGFKIVPFDDLAALEAAMTSNTCAVMLEPIQAEAGILIPSPGFLKGVQALCREHNALLIADEIQTGLGRTGKMFAFQHDDIEPDVIIVGKALSGGFYPVSAVMADDEVMGVFHPGDHGSTYGGNPLGSALAVTAIQILEDEKLVERAELLGKQFLESLKAIPSRYVKEVRGRGMLIGIELNTPARRFCEALKMEGVLCKETHETVIRFAPPLVISEHDLMWAEERIKKVLLSNI